MTKKTYKPLSIEDKSGLNALFYEEAAVGIGKAREKEPVSKRQKEKEKQYLLNIEKSIFKKLDERRVNTGIPIKRQIVEAIRLYLKSCGLETAE